MLNKDRKKHRKHTLTNIAKWNKDKEKIEKQKRRKIEWNIQRARKQNRVEQIKIKLEHNKPKKLYFKQSYTMQERETNKGTHYTYNKSTDETMKKKTQRVLSIQKKKLTSQWQRKMKKFRKNKINERKKWQERRKEIFDRAKISNPTKKWPESKINWTSTSSSNLLWTLRRVGMKFKTKQNKKTKQLSSRNWNRRPKFWNSWKFVNCDCFWKVVGARDTHDKHKDQFTNPPVIQRKTDAAKFTNDLMNNIGQLNIRIIDRALNECNFLF